MKSESIKEITVALSKAQVAFKPIKRTEKVGYDTKSGAKKYNYAPLDVVIDATKEALSANGLAVSQTTYIQGGGIILETLLSHSSGEWVSGELFVAKLDTPPQILGSALTYMRRYAYSAILCVASEEDDDAQATEPTPAEEMTGEATDERPANLEHWCETHRTKFFKRGKMPGYAHQLEGGGWHNESFPEKPPAKTTTITFSKPETATTSTPEDATKQGTGEQAGVDTQEQGEGAVTAEKDEGKQPLVDLDWLRESLVTLQWVDVGNYLKKKYGVTGKKVSEIVSLLTQEQKAEFIKEVQDRLNAFIR